MVGAVALAAGAACDDRERIVIAPDNGGGGGGGGGGDREGPVTAIAVPALPDTVVTAGPGVFIAGRMDDATGIDTLYVDVSGGITRYPPIDQDGRRGVAFALPFTTAGQQGEEIVVLIHGVDVLGNRGSAVRRRILVQ